MQAHLIAAERTHRLLTSQLWGGPWPQHEAGSIPGVPQVMGPRTTAGSCEEYSGLSHCCQTKISPSLLFGGWGGGQGVFLSGEILFLKFLHVCP